MKVEMLKYFKIRKSVSFKKQSNISSKGKNFSGIQKCCIFYNVIFFFFQHNTRYITEEFLSSSQCCLCPHCLSMLLLSSVYRYKEPICVGRFSALQVHKSLQINIRPTYPRSKLNTLTTFRKMTKYCLEAGEQWGRQHLFYKKFVFIFLGKL